MAVDRSDAHEDETAPVSGVRSRAAIGGHPLHPMVIPLPIGLLVAALATDLGYWATTDPFWARASWWALWAGLATGVLAALLGLIDFLAIPRVREHFAGRIHLASNATALLVTAANLAVRSSGGMEAGLLPWGLVLTAITAAALGVGGWYGGELSYRHAVGVTGH